MKLYNLNNTRNNWDDLKLILAHYTGVNSIFQHVGKH